jgi:hypothetical protein
MSFDAWPSPESRRGPLPRIEDLPVREQGYDQESVRRAFDDFYRHAAQLDASLKALEAVEAFRRDAAELRHDLRALHALGVGSVSDPGWSRSTSWTYDQPVREVSAAALRIGAEAALLIAVGVVAGVSHLRAWVIVALMGAALVVVWLSEWLAARARTRVPANVYEPIAYADPPPAAEGEPAPYVEAVVLEQEVGWSAFEAPAEDDEELPPAPLEDTEEGASPAVAEAPEPEPEPAQADELQPAVGADPDGDERTGRGWFRRRRGKSALPGEVEPDADSAPPSHVRVLAAGEPHDAPWERGFDGEPEEG